MASQPLAAFASQLPKPALHVKPHALAAQVATAFAGMGHTTHAAPHAVASVAVAHFAPQRCVAAGHVPPHVSATQVAVPPAGIGQGTQSGPQVAGSVFATHLALQAWNWALHVKPHAPAVQAFVAFATTGHFTLQAPQLSVLVFGSTHSAPQLTGAIGVQPFVHWNDGPDGAQSGAAAAHFALHVPQLVALERSISQPSVELALQSEYPGSQAATMHLRPWQPIELCVEGQGVHVASPQP